MDWKKELIQRKHNRDKLYKEISKIKKQIKNIGTCNYIEYICQEIENKYGYPCRPNRNDGFFIFKKEATKKQIQYRRAILRTIFTIERNGKYYFDETVNPHSSYNWEQENLIEIPNTIEDILAYIIKTDLIGEINDGESKI